MSFLDKYINTNYSSYNDFIKNYKVNVPENFNFVYDVLDELARTKPNERALVWCDDNGGEQIFTFSQMAEKVNQTANFFQSIGIKKGDFVMLILKRRYEFWYSILALHKIGAITIPATHLLTKKDMVYRNNAASIRAIVALNDAEIIKHVDESLPESPTLELRVIVGGKKEGWVSFEEGVENSSSHFERPQGEAATKNSDIMLVYFTSGTTGLPKMVAHNYEYPLGHIVTAKFWQKCTVGGLHLTVADTGWAKAMWGKLYGQWFCESAIFVYDMDKFDAVKLLDKITKYKVTTFCAPPTMYRFIVRAGLENYDLSFIKHASIAGEPLNPEIYHKFYKITGLKLTEGFGQTETTVSIVNFEWFEPRPGSMGKPAPLYDIQIVKDDGTPCEVGEEGEIVINIGENPPVGYFLGYHLDEALTKSVWHDGVYHTGDIAWCDEDGYFWYVGRSDDVIKSSGYRIGPFEVESALMEHPAVLETAITAVPDEVRGQIVKATIILAKGYEPSEELKKEIQDHVKRTTAPYKYPRVIDFVTELPKTISGKIRRVDIRQSDS